MLTGKFRLVRPITAPFIPTNDRRYNNQTSTTLQCKLHFRSSQQPRLSCYAHLYFPAKISIKTFTNTYCSTTPKNTNFLIFQIWAISPHYLAQTTQNSSNFVAWGKTTTSQIIYFDILSLFLLHGGTKGLTTQSKGHVRHTRGIITVTITITAVTVSAPTVHSVQFRNGHSAVWWNGSEC